MEISGAATGALSSGPSSFMKPMSNSFLLLALEDFVDEILPSVRGVPGLSFFDGDGDAKGGVFLAFPLPIRGVRLLGDVTIAKDSPVSRMRAYGDVDRKKRETYCEGETAGLSLLRTASPKSIRSHCFAQKICLLRPALLLYIAPNYQCPLPGLKWPRDGLFSQTTDSSSFLSSLQCMSLLFRSCLLTVLGAQLGSRSRLSPLAGCFRSGLVFVGSARRED